jgi:S-disulfanyl-L-cysteine oxidoreductase SoxD
MRTLEMIFAFSALLVGSVSAFGQTPQLGQVLQDREIPFFARYIMPDGAGLPAGSGSATAGRRVWESRCASCHGATGSEGPIMPPVGPTATYAKSAGKYWPYATTLFDYIRRAMPFPSPKSLSDEDVYSVTAFILYRNGLIKENESIDANSLPRLAMPGRDNLTDLWAKQGEKPY